MSLSGLSSPGELLALLYILCYSPFLLASEQEKMNNSINRQTSNKQTGR